MFKQFSFLFILIFFHELGHTLSGLFFKWKIISITFYPYGGVTLFSKLENSKMQENIKALLMENKKLENKITKIEAQNTTLQLALGNIQKQTIPASV